MQTKDIQTIIGLFGIATIGYIVFNKNTPEVQEEIEPTPIPTPTPVQPIPLNKNLVLAIGSRNAEVELLQQLLNIPSDGIFGPLTQKALMAIKGVKSITLNQFATKANVNNKPLKIGDKVMAYRKPSTPTFYSKLLADGTYHMTPDVFDDYDFGDAIGTIKMMTPDKLHYVVRSYSFNSAMIFVRATDVKKI